MFEEGREEVFYNHCSGQPLTNHTDENETGVHNLLNCDSRIRVRKIVLQILNRQIATVHAIMTNDLKMRKVCV